MLHTVCKMNVFYASSTVQFTNHDLRFFIPSVWSTLIKVKKSCEHLPPTPKPVLSPRPTIFGRVWDANKKAYTFDTNKSYWCLPCCEVWYDKVKDNIERLGRTKREEAFEMAGDPLKQIKTFSSCEDLKEHIKAVHIFSKQVYEMVCPMQGCAETNVNIRHHMKVLHGIDEDGVGEDGSAEGDNPILIYCTEPDSKNGICGCRIDCGNNDFMDDYGEYGRHCYHHGFGLRSLRDAASVYKRINQIINPWE